MDINALNSIADCCETPSYVFDMDALRQRIDSIENGLDDRVTICYAMKANPFLAAPLSNKMEKFEVCSPGEFRICERCGLDIKKVVLSGVYKNKEDMERIVGKYRDAPTYTIESAEQFRLLSDCAHKESVRMDILLRLSSGNQFGMDKETLERILKKAIDDPQLHVKGLQLFSGTQKRKVKHIAAELLEFDAYCMELQQKYDIAFEEMEFGPGLYVSYFNHEEEQDDIILEAFKEAVRGTAFRGRIIFEMGRFIAASCGYYLTSVVDIKRTCDENYCILDGGINHINYYGQTMAMRTPYIERFPARNGEQEEWNICGALCTTGDVLAKQYPLTSLELGDVLIFKKIGAYSITEGIYLFLSRDLPAVYFYSEAEGLKKVRSVQPTDILNSPQE